MTKRKVLSYPLPSELDPDVVCIRAYIPNAPEYIAAWWQSYEYLAKWVAWDKDEAGSAKDAASAWRYCVERARLDYELLRGCDYVTPPQHDDDGQSELADYLWHWYDILTEAAEFVHDGMTIAQWRAYVTDTYDVYLAKLADPIYDAIEQMEYEDAIDEIDNLPWPDMYFGSWCEYSYGCAGLPFMQIPTCYISEIIDSIVDTLQGAGGTVAAAFEDAISAIFDPNGMGEQGDWASTIAAKDMGDNWSFDEIVCHWSRLFDFALSEQGWESYADGTPPAAVWQSGVGWVAQSSPTNTFSTAYIGAQFGDVKLDAVDLSVNSSHYCASWGARLRLYNDATLIYSDFIAEIYAGNRVYHWDITPATCNRIHVTVEGHKTPPPTISVDRCTVHGIDTPLE